MRHGGVCLELNLGGPGRGLLGWGVLGWNEQFVRWTRIGEAFTIFWWDRENIQARETLVLSQNYIKEASVDTLEFYIIHDWGKKENNTLWSLSSARCSLNFNTCLCFTFLHVMIQHCRCQWQKAPLLSCKAHNQEAKTTL